MQTIIKAFNISVAAPMAHCQWPIPYTFLQPSDKIFWRRHMLDHITHSRVHWAASALVIGWSFVFTLHSFKPCPASNIVKDIVIPLPWSAWSPLPVGLGACCVSWLGCCGRALQFHICLLWWFWGTPNWLQANWKALAEKMNDWKMANNRFLTLLL